MNRLFVALLTACACVIVATRTSQAQRPELIPTPPIAGRWDLTIHSMSGDYPSWLEVQHSGFTTLVGYFVGQSGSVRPISEMFFANGKVQWSLPRQWEWMRAGKGELSFEGTLSSDKLEGSTTDDAGKSCKWTAVRAPKLKREKAPSFVAPIELFNSKDLTGWRSSERGRPRWEARDGLLVNARPGTNLVTTQTFTDFKLHAEFRYPRGSNSGIYLRGRYEVQIEDNYGQEPDAHGIGGVYGFLKPRINACKRPGEWQSYDIILVGRTVTVTLNGELVIDRQEIPGITGGALDSNEALPGPIYLQGDHGPIDFRKLTLTPGK